ncbi:hypothetical protein H4R21_001591, partial [Coemansia helicoidea]
RPRTSGPSRRSAARLSARYSATCTRGRWCRSTSRCAWATGRSRRRQSTRPRWRWSTPGSRCARWSPQQHARCCPAARSSSTRRRRRRTARSLCTHLPLAAARATASRCTPTPGATLEWTSTTPATTCARRLPGACWHSCARPLRARWPRRRAPPRR